MRASGRCSTSPSVDTTSRAATAPRLAGSSSPAPPVPNAITMKTTSVPSSMVMLNAALKAKLSQRALLPAAARMAAVFFANAACSSCSGIRPAERRMALRSQRRPNSRINATNNKLHQVEWNLRELTHRNSRERWAKHGDDGGQHRQSCRGSCQRAAPSAHAAHRQHHRQAPPRTPPARPGTTPPGSCPGESLQDVPGLSPFRSSRNLRIRAGFKLRHATHRMLVTAPVRACRKASYPPMRIAPKPNAALRDHPQGVLPRCDRTAAGSRTYCARRAWRKPPLSRQQPRRGPTWPPSTTTASSPRPSATSRKRPRRSPRCNAPRSPGTVHDYYSEAPTRHAARRTGVREDSATAVPFTAHRDALFTLGLAVPALAAAYLLTGEERYAEHAVLQLRAWFVDPATRMAPSLDFGAVLVNQHQLPRRHSALHDRRTNPVSPQLQPLLRAAVSRASWRRCRWWRSRRPSPSSPPPLPSAKPT